MTDKIDFTKWTDRQLLAGQKYRTESDHGVDLQAEIDRRKAEGTWSIRPIRPRRRR